MKETPKEAPSDSPGGAGGAAELNVEVFYRERMLLPPTATLTVTLEDGAKMDVAADKIAEVAVATTKAPPYRVTLRYERSNLDARGRFGVRARIENEGRLIFTSTQFNPAFGADGSTDAPPHDPVRVLVTRVAGARNRAAASLTGTRWIFRKLRGEDAGAGAGGRAASFTLAGAEPRISGFAGCNQITGSYEVDGDRLSFSKMAMTMRACSEGMDLERDVAKALEETKRYAIIGNVLTLFGDDGVKVAELEAE